jgi:hypothetical protein
VKPDEVTAVMVPDEPPGSAPVRALDPPPFLNGAPVAEEVAVVEGAVAAAQPESPTTQASTTAAIHPLLLFGSNRRKLDWLVFVGSFVMMEFLSIRNLLKGCEPFQ